MRSYSSMLAAALALVSTSKAHMKMGTPAPYGAASLNNSPLAGDGSDFPCKQRPGVYDQPTTKNSMAIGAQQEIALIGSAVHGGGSCQISLTEDLKPTKTSKWMVIHAIEGGCPAKVAGNLDPNASGTAAPKIPYKIPEGINPGEYTLAWTWFNRIGLREMYMNCAPITVTGGSKKRFVDEASFNTTEEIGSDEVFKRDTAFPDMFKANIGQVSNGCKTVETFDTVFPSPGKSVVKGGTLEDISKTLEGNCGSASPGGSDSSSPAASPAAGASGSLPSVAAGDSGSPTVSGAGSDSNSSSAAGAASPAATSIVAIPPPGAPGAAKSSAAAPMATGQTSPAAATGSAMPSGNASSGSSSSGSTGGTAASSTGSCSTPGQSVCSPDGMKIGTCGMNKMAAFMAVAPGTKCSGGQLVHANQKRSAKFAKSYARHY
ncbi:MAG: hypothetical protein Q9166_005897 [cf. Caloplaca sp. 2 TL-2023]